MGTEVYHVKIEAVQTVAPSKVTDPRKIRRVVSDPNIGLGTLGQCLYLILYYKTNQEESGWIHAGWVKESLGKAFSHHPLLAGRIRKQEDHKGLFEVVSNDSGARLIEARVPLNLSEFLDSKRNKNLDLVYWEDIDEQNPQFSPLFYVQVTNFECGGYSFGISCSLLLGDVLLKENFLKRWAEIHNKIVSKDELPKRPLFYLPNLKKDGGSVGNIFNSTCKKDKGDQTFVLNITSVHEIEDSKNDLIISKRFARLCVEKAESQLGNKIIASDDQDFSLVVIEAGQDVIKVDKCSIYELVVPQHDNLILKNQIITSTSLDEVGVKEIEFYKGNQPLDVSYWIRSNSGGLVMAISFAEESKSKARVIASIPIQKQSFLD